MDLKIPPHARCAASGQAVESAAGGRKQAIPVRINPAACAALAEAVESAKRALKVTKPLPGC